MKPQLLSHLRSGLIAILASGLSAPALAGPSGFVAPPAQPAEVGSQSSEVIQIQNRSRRWIRRSGSGKNWSGRGNWAGRGNWDGGGSGKRWARSGNWSSNNWSHNGNWSGKRNWRRWNHGGHWDDDDDWWPGFGSGLVLGLGLPLLGHYSPYWYGDPYQYSAPRRVYSMSSEHVAWCYDRWRSYREYDNSYQPFNGPRRHCRSPYG